MASLKITGSVLLIAVALADSVSGTTVARNSTHIEFVKQNVSQEAQSSMVTCSFDSDCYTSAGYNSKCYHGLCICDLGYRGNTGRCLKVKCFFNSDCTKYFYNTRCDFTDSCVCDYGTYKDYDSQTCLYDYSGGSSWSVGVPLGIIIFFLVMACIVVAIIRNQRRQVITRTVPVPGPIVPPPPSRTMVPQPQPPMYQTNPLYQQQQNPSYPQINPTYPQLNPYQNQAPPPYNPAYAQPVQAANPTFQKF